MAFSVFLRGVTNHVIPKRIVKNDKSSKIQKGFFLIFELFIKRNCLEFFKKISELTTEIVHDNSLL